MRENATDLKQQAQTLLEKAEDNKNIVLKAQQAAEKAQKEAQAAVKRKLNLLEKRLIEY